MYVKGPYTKELIHNSRIALCNTKTGAYVKTARQYYDYLLQYLKTNNKSVFRSNEAAETNVEILFQELCKIRYLIPEDCYEKERNINMQVVYLSITDRCNLQCRHCITNAIMEKDDCLDTKTWKGIIDQVIGLFPNEIVFTGGEPLIRKDFCDLLEYTYEKYNGAIILSTNGLLMTEKVIKNLIKYVDTIAISLDGYDEYSCARVRGEGVFGQVINTIKKLKMHGFHRITLSMLESTYTIGHNKEFYELCDSLDVKPVLRKFSPSGRGEENREELLSVSEYEGKIEKENLRCMLCRPGRKELNISSKGDLYPCVPLSGDRNFCIGNLKQKRLDQLLDSSVIEKLVEPYRPWNMERCKACDVNLFCHDCMNYIISIRQEPNSFEQICRKKRAELTKLIWEE